jgi:uncharacterized protein (UPF0335 family)
VQGRVEVIDGGLRAQIENVTSRLEEMKAPTEELIKDIVKEKEAILRELEKLYQQQRE